MAPPAASLEESRRLLKAIINEVEDEFSGILYNPQTRIDDGRMYAPLEDNRRAVPGRPDVIRYRSRRHNTYFSSGGAIKIVSDSGQTWLEKPGANGELIGRI